MGMPHATERWTPDRVRALPNDGNRYEVVHGELLVTPAPNALHQRAVGKLHLHLGTYFQGSTIGEVLLSPADISFDPDWLVQPDVFVVPLGPGGHKVRQWSEIRGLLLAVEVLSPSTARADRQVKRRLYQEAGVGEYWIVDLDARVVERWRPGDARPEVLTDVVRWQPDPRCEPLSIDLATFFAEVLGAP